MLPLEMKCLLMTTLLYNTKEQEGQSYGAFGAKLCVLVIRGTQMGWPVSWAQGPAPRTVIVFECHWNRAQVGSGDQ